jgi:hypothetical protein
VGSARGIVVIRRRGLVDLPTRCSSVSWVISEVNMRKGTMTIWGQLFRAVRGGSAKVAARRSCSGGRAPITQTTIQAVIKLVVMGECLITAPVAATSSSLADARALRSGPQSASVLIAAEMSFNRLRASDGRT